MDLIILVEVICVFLFFNYNSALLLWWCLQNYNFIWLKWVFLRGNNCCNYLAQWLLWLIYTFICWFSNTETRIGLYFSRRASFFESILSRNILFIIILSGIKLLVILFFIWKLHSHLLLFVWQAVSSYWRFLERSNRTSYICQLLIVHCVL